MSQKIKYLIQKGLISLREQGIKQTCFKVLSYYVCNTKIGFDDWLNNYQEDRCDNYVQSGHIKFSILVPLYNTPESFLKEMIESVQKQTYTNWELCMADGSDSAHEYVMKVCQEYCNLDDRIRYKKLDNNLGISGNTNICIQMATGEYIALFDHDDLLHPEALSEVMKKIEDTNADFIYTDEAVFVSNLDNIISIHRKPDYAPDNLRANNYICHFSVFSKKLLNKTENFRSEYDGSQDHDLILRLTHVAEKVVHIPKILYYWRSHSESVASGIGAKSYAVKAGQNSVKNYMASIGQPCMVESLDFCPTIYRIKYKLLAEPLVSIVVWEKNSKELNCVNTIIEKTSYSNYEIVVLMPFENRKTKELNLKKSGVAIKYVNCDKETFSICMNKTIDDMNGDYIVMYDSVLRPENNDWLQELLMYAQRDDVGVVGSKICFKNNIIKYAKISVSGGKKTIEFPYRYHSDSEQGYMGKLHYAQNVSAVAADCVMFKKEVFLTLNGFDECYETELMKVIDFCMRARNQQYLVVWNPYASFYSRTKFQNNIKLSKDKKIFNKRYTPTKDIYCLY